MARKIDYLVEILNDPRIYILLVISCAIIFAITYRFSFLNAVDVLLTTIGILLFVIPLFVRTGLLNILTKNELPNKRFFKEIEIIERLLNTYANQFKENPSIKIKAFSFPNLIINAFSGTLYVTQGLLENVTSFSQEELRAAIGHEIGHKNRVLRDTLFAILVISVSTLLIFCFLTLLYILLIVYKALLFGSSVFTFKIVVLFPAVFCFYLVFFYVGRYREYKADEESIKLGNERKYLISFLRKLDNFYKSYEHDKPKNKVLSLIDSLFGTHPSIDDRIKKLEQYQKGSVKARVGESSSY